MRSLLVFLFIGLTRASQECLKYDTIDEGPIFFAQRQPVYLNLLPKIPGINVLDNICLTYWPLPDDPYSFLIIESRVYCDGSTEVLSFMDSPLSKGVDRIAGAETINTDQLVGYAGCETHLRYRCSTLGGTFDPFVFGLSFDCKPLGLSCLRRVEEIIKEKNLPENEWYALPMKLPSRCVTQRTCTLPPNPFYNHLANNYGSAFLY